jgi:hypothetical protein
MMLMGRTKYDLKNENWIMTLLKDMNDCGFIKREHEYEPKPANAEFIRKIVTRQSYG